jgi:hypothetical protein
MLTIYLLDHWYITLAIIAILVVVAEVGFRLGCRRQTWVDDNYRSQLSTMQASTLGLLALLLGFTFALAASRFEARKALVLKEANAIGTAHLRLGLLQAPDRGELEALMRRYVDARVDFSRAENWESFRAAQAASSQLQSQLWMRVGDLARTDGRPVPHGMILQALNEVIDIDGECRAALFNCVPDIILELLMGVGTFAMLINGYSVGVGGTRSLFALIAMPIMIAAVIAVIIDLDRPRRGLIQVDQQSLIALQGSLKGD